MLQIKKVSKVYQLGSLTVKALDDVSLHIKRGTIMCIMGKSGSGKSTLLRQVSLIDRPTSGQIIIDGQEVAQLRETKRSKLRLSKLGYVFQEYALIQELTALENVYLPALMLGTRAKNYKKKATKMLELVGLGDRLNHRPRELSGGQQQRVAIARALINTPAIIYADEPTANLDSQSSKTVMEALVQLNRELNVTVVFVSHDPDDRKYAKEVVFLRDGKLTEPYL
jgi:putative ABC transport system ATP-binding protein